MAKGMLVPVVALGYFQPAASIQRFEVRHGNGSLGQESNLQPTVYKTAALPFELPQARYREKDLNPRPP